MLSDNDFHILENQRSYETAVYASNEDILSSL